jgi:hypothetical protein
VSKSQGSLEYIIIIGGVIILAAASYFMLRGFSQTTAGETDETIDAVGDKFRLELENMGRSETRFKSKKWPSITLSMLTNFSFNCLDNLVLNTTNLTAYGIDTSAMSFYCFKNSEFCFLNHTIAGDILTVTQDSSCCKSPYTFYMFYNNSSPLTDPCSMNYTFPCTVNLCDPPQTKADTVPPHIEISSVGYIISGEAWIDATVDGTGSNLTLVQYSIDSSGWIKAHNIWYNPAGMVSHGRPKDGSWDESDYLLIFTDITSPATHTVSVRAVDEYGNENTSSQQVSFMYAGSPDISYWSLSWDQDADGIATLSSCVLEMYDFVCYKNQSSPLNSSRGGGEISFTEDYSVLFWYEDNYADPNQTLRYAKRTGTTWTDPVNLTSGNIRIFNKAFDFNGTGGGILTFSYINESSGGYGIKYSIWDGNQFSQPTHFPWHDENIEVPFPALASMNSTHFMLVYCYNCTGNDLRCANYSIWDGSSWSTPAEIVNETVVLYDIDFPSLDFANANEGMFVARQVNSPTSPLYKTVYSHWDGTSWSALQNISTQNAENETNPQVEYDSLDQAVLTWTLGDLFSPPTMPKYVVYDGSFGPIQDDTDMQNNDPLFAWIQIVKHYTDWIIAAPVFAVPDITGDWYVRIYNWDSAQRKFVITPTTILVKNV